LVLLSANTFDITAKITRVTTLGALAPLWEFKYQVIRAKQGIIPFCAVIANEATLIASKTGIFGVN
jgi:hypothetical protein